VTVGVLVLLQCFQWMPIVKDALCFLFLFLYLTLNYPAYFNSTISSCLVVSLVDVLHFELGSCTLSVIVFSF
jgi:hypothetical protein